MIQCRSYEERDNQFLKEMFFEAVFWSRQEEDRPTLDEGLSYDYTKDVLRAFGERQGDIAVIAEFDHEYAVQHLLGTGRQKMRLEVILMTGFQC